MPCPLWARHRRDRTRKNRLSDSVPAAAEMLLALGFHPHLHFRRFTHTVKRFVILPTSPHVPSVHTQGGTFRHLTHKAAYFRHFTHALSTVCTRLFVIS